MIVTAHLYVDDPLVSLDLYPDMQKSGVIDAPDDRPWPFQFNYDDAPLADGTRRFLGIDVLDITNVDDTWLCELDKLNLPRVDVTNANLRNVTVADVLRWARASAIQRRSLSVS